MADDPDDVISLSPVSGILTSADPTATVTVTAESLRALRLAAVSDDHGQPRRRGVLGLHQLVQASSPASDSAQAVDDAVYASRARAGPTEYRAGPSLRPGAGGHHGRVL